MVHINKLVPFLILILASCGKGEDISSQPDSRIFGIWDVTSKWTPSEVNSEKTKAAKREKLLAFGPAIIPQDLVEKTPESGIYQLRVSKDKIQVIYQKDEDNPETIKYEYDCRIIHWQKTIFQADCAGKGTPDTVFSFYIDKEKSVPVLLVRKVLSDDLNAHFTLRKLSDID